MMNLPIKGLHKMGNLIVSGVLILGLAGCATSTTKLALEPSPGQQLKFHNGDPALLDAKQHRAAIMLHTLEVKNGSRLHIEIALHNRSEEPLNFYPQEISAAIEINGAVETKGKIITYDQLLQEERDRQREASITMGLAALSGALNSYNAGYSQSQGTFNGYTNGDSITGSYTSSTYDQGAAHQAAEAERMRLQDMSVTESEIQSAKNAYLARLARNHTLKPNEKYGANIVIETPQLSKNDKANIILEIPFGEEKYDFLLVLEREK